MLDQVLSVLAELAKALFIPGSVPFLLLGMTLGVILLLMDENRRTRGRGLLAALAVLYWVLSLPASASALEGLLADAYRPLETVLEAEGARTVVVLGGGSVTLRSESASIDVVSEATTFRVLEAERLYELLGQPTLILSGGPPPTLAEASAESQAMRDLLVARGVAPEHILLDTASGNTHEQSIVVAGMLAEQQAVVFVLVTSPIHMRRAAGAFADEGLSPIPSAAVEGPRPEDATPFLPSEAGLRRSQAVMREAIALAYYLARGWLTTP
jgi:uncharacterized SAM-binding protein YcdF (DUF218 family)